ncbi:MAG TPA: preprotein translocase subunit SecE [Lachnospiraceae bacterium]|nr:preprotein translocase subunit SecE [Lachnospiraceae bacterium]
MADKVEVAEKVAKKTVDSAKGFNLKDFVKAHVGEFKRIVWPSRKTLVKETISVIVISVILGAIIFLLDTGFQAGYDALARLVSGLA